MLKTNNEETDARDTMVLFSAMEAMPVPVKLTKPKAKTSSSHTKFNLLISTGLVNQLLATLNSRKNSEVHRTPK
ncbi:hypothetical protein CVD23_13620 [Bacillus sp. V33-4]|nr:hypothetical protein [Bacillus sp. V33-4]PLR83668.1 hypothetical protein CVD23_13620 [Bacillus sp. V33-4]